MSVSIEQIGDGFFLRSVMREIASSNVLVFNINVNVGEFSAIMTRQFREHFAYISKNLQISDGE